MTESTNQSSAPAPERAPESGTPVGTPVDDADAATAPRTRRGIDWLLAATVAIVIFLLGIQSPGYPVDLDGKYTLILAETILLHGDAFLGRYAPYPDYIYQVQYLQQSGHHVSLYPLGGPLTMVPVVAITRALGYPVVNEEASGQEALDFARNRRLQTPMASLMMAWCGALMFAAARGARLGRATSVAVALFGIVGTTMFSVGAGGIWADTIGVTLLTTALTITWWLKPPRSDSAGGPAPRRVALTITAAAFVGLLLGIATFVKPPYLLTSGAVFFLLFLDAILRRRPWHQFGAAVATFVAIGLIARTVDDLLTPGAIHPYYAAVNALSFDNVFPNLAGVLFSPSRGLFIFIPLLLPLAIIGAIRWRRVDWPAILALSSAVGAQVLLVAMWSMWWGGDGYGPRILLCVMPLLVFLGIEVLRTGPLHKATIALLIALGLFSTALHLRGSYNFDVWLWNHRVVASLDALWDWDYPQPLAGLIRLPIDHTPPPVESMAIALDDTAPEHQFHSGWGSWEGQIRWTTDDESLLVLGALPPGVTGLRLAGTPFLFGDKLTQQRLRVLWNDSLIHESTMRANIDVTIELPASVLDGEVNVLTFDLPDSTSPKSVGMSEDPRQLGLAIAVVELLTE